MCHLVNGKYQTSSKWKTTDNHFKITTDFNGEKLKSGESYTYGVIAYSAKTGNTVVSAPVTVTVRNTVKPSKTSITGLSSSKGKLTVSWKKYPPVTDISSSIPQIRNSAPKPPAQ